MPPSDTSNAPGVHHYIPIFYTKRWASGSPRMLTRFTQWPSGNFAVDRKAPKGVGWERDGYAFDGFSGDEAAAIELKLMKPKDHRASQILARLEQNGTSGHWTSEERYDWTWFIVSLLVRGPEDVRSAKVNVSREWAIPNERMEERYRNVIREFPGFTAPASLREYIASQDENYGKRLGMKIMADMTDHNAISTMIANMHWGVRSIEAGRQLLTSDRPVRQEFPLRSEQSFVTLPIGPQRIFVAAKSPRGLNRLLQSDPRVLVERNNRKIVRQARQFVFATDDSERDWVWKNIAREPQPAFFDFIESRAAGRNHP
ncbi:DUF4238 domain-containing protein [Rhizobium phaseoli]|uniref:DUF4238 domain-containing protein n=1 Tax=Rhizobium phaseoli TaxID=396 RepID=UPI0016768B61|nr:DUF4238 domain-containing protein [Rhizobium phaseoli]